MNKEIRENFTKWRDSDFKERFNKLSFLGFAPSMAKASLFAWMGYQQAVKDTEAEKNDNQLKGLPADIDLLIQAANAVIRQVDNRRILHLKSVVDRVKPQYDELFKG